MILCMDEIQDEHHRAGNLGIMSLIEIPTKQGFSGFLGGAKWISSIHSIYPGSLRQQATQAGRSLESGENVALLPCGDL